MKKIKNTILTLGSIGLIGAPITAVVSCSSLTGEFDHRVINQYGDLSTSVVEGQRAFDPNFTAGNKFSLNKLDNAATVLPLIRSNVTGKDKPVYTPDPTEKYKYDISFSTTQKTNYVFDAIDNLTVGLSGGKKPRTYYHYKDIQDDINTQDKKKQLDSKGWTSLTFQVKKGVHYVNYKNQPQKYEMVGKDFLYGMIRTLYAGTELRDGGKVNGNTISYLPKFSDSDNKLLNDNDGKTIASMNNPNSYLFDLFNIDLPKTIQDNLQLAKSSAPDDKYKFKIDFITTQGNTGGQFSSLSGFFADSSTFSPQSSQKIDELAEAWSTKTGQKLDSNPGIKYGISNYGYNNFKGVSLEGYKDYLSVTPYIYTKFDVMDEYTIVQNKHFLDPHWASDIHTIRKFTYHILPPGGDPSARILQRISNYKAGIESILDQSVYKSPLFEQFKRDPQKSGYTYHRLVEAGIANSFGWDIQAPLKSIMVNGSPGYKGLGYKMMYGSSDPNTIESGGFAAVNTFMNGSGSVLRNVINNAFNAYTMVQESTTASNQTANRGILKPESHLWNGDKEVIAGNPDFAKASPKDPATSVYNRPDGADTDANLKAIYDQNSSTDIHKAYQVSPQVEQKYQNDLKQLAQQVGASTSSPAQIPILFYRYSDANLDPLLKKVYQNILDTLNNLDKGVVVFKEADTLPQNQFTAAMQTGRGIMLHYTPWGPDYPLATSNYQGLYSVKMGNSAILGLLYHDLVTAPESGGKIKPFVPKLVNAINNSPTGTFTMLGKASTSDLKAAFDKISINDISIFTKDSDAASKIKDQNEYNLLMDMTKVISKPFYAISSDKTAVTNLTAYYENHAFSYPFVTASASIPNIISTVRTQTAGQDPVAAAEIVKKPWLVTATSSNGTYLLMDYRVDETY